MNDDGQQAESLLHEAEKFRSKLLDFFSRMGVPRGDGEDFVQETFLRLWNYRDRYRPTAKLSTFLFTLARQVRIDAIRSRAQSEKREHIWSEERGEIQLPPNFGEREEVRQAVQRLTEPLREVVELGVFQDMPYAEIAEVLSVPVGTVKSRMFNALKKLKEIFNER